MKNSSITNITLTKTKTMQNIGKNLWQMTIGKYAVVYNGNNHLIRVIDNETKELKQHFQVGEDFTVDQFEKYVEDFEKHVICPPHN